MTRFAPRPGISTERDIAPTLLVFLREHVGDPSLDFVEPPARLPAGFDTTIYTLRLASTDPAYAAPFVLRVFRDEDDPKRARFEAAVHHALAAQGYPAPRVLAVGDAGVIGGAFMLMERLPGSDMIGAFFGPRFLQQPRALASLHAQLHNLDPAPVRASVRAASAEGALDADDLPALRQRIVAARLDGLIPALEWLERHRPAPPTRLSVCHGDFHPLNIMLDGKHISGVLDWANTRIADPAWDVGAAVALFGQAPVDLPSFIQGPIALARRRLLRRYLAAYAEQHPIDLEAVHYYEAARCVGFLLEAGEHIQSSAGAIGAIEKPTAFAQPRVQQRIRTRIHEITGTTVTLPPPTVR